MNKEDIHFGDWQRILFGDGPPLYLLEVVVRVAIIYAVILISMRMLGKRMTAEVSRAEIVARVSLAAAVGLPIQRSSYGLLEGIIIAIIIVIVGRAFAIWAYRSTKFEQAFQGTYTLLIKDGVMNLKKLRTVRISKERLFASLRQDGIRQLGQVARFYMEPSGEFSLVCAAKEKPGLSIIPDCDKELRNRQPVSDQMVCNACGDDKNDMDQSCKNCGTTKNATAYITHRPES